MAIQDALTTLRNGLNQCDSLIAHAHGSDASGNSVLPSIDQRQVTVAAFLNAFIAWESFLETSLLRFMIGESTVSGFLPVRYVLPPSQEKARAMLIGVNRYFDFGNHEYVRKIARLFFENGYPYEPHLSSISSELADLRTMRNASAHITSTTQSALEALAVRIFGKPMLGIGVYQMLMSVDPKSSTRDTVYLTYRQKLEVSAELIATG